MTRDEVAPLETGDDAFYCPACGGSGLEETGNGDVILCRVRCDWCGGSGYGPPPPEMDRLMQHCLHRLQKWAERHPIGED